MHPLDPTDINGINNNAGEAYHILYSRVHGIRATSLRLSNTYGPRHQMRHHRQGIINWFVRLAIEGREIPLFGDGTQVRDTNYVADVVPALLLAGANEASTGEVFNIGGEPASLLTIAEQLSRLTGVTYRLAPFPADLQAIEIGDYVADWTKANKVLGWSPMVNLTEGLRRTVDYYRQHREHYW